MVGKVLYLLIQGAYTPAEGVNGVSDLFHIAECPSDLSTLLQVAGFMCVLFLRLNNISYIYVCMNIYDRIFLSICPSKNIYIVFICGYCERGMISKWINAQRLWFTRGSWETGSE